MSRAKFDFTGYDPKAQRKQKEPSPERKVIVKVEDDMEIFTTDFIDPEGAIDINIKNEKNANDTKEHANEKIFGMRD